MKITIPDDVAAGALTVIEALKHPDARHVARELRGNLAAKEEAQKNQLSADEWSCVVEAVDMVLTLIEPPAENTWCRKRPALIAHLRDARPKLKRLEDRQRLRETGLLPAKGDGHD